jgi:hypothetical protein
MKINAASGPGRSFNLGRWLLQKHRIENARPNISRYRAAVPISVTERGRTGRQCRFDLK